MQSVVILFLLLFSSCWARAQVIYTVDSFDDGNFTQANTTTEFTYTGTSMLGGERRVKMSAGPSNITSVSGGLLTYSTPNDSMRVEVSYGKTIVGDPNPDLHFDGSSYRSVFLDLTAAERPAWVSVQMFSYAQPQIWTTFVGFFVTGPGVYVAGFSDRENINELSGFTLFVPDAFYSGSPLTYTIDSWGFTTAIPEPEAYACGMGVFLAALATSRRMMLRKACAGMQSLL